MQVMIVRLSPEPGGSPGPGSPDLYSALHVLLPPSTLLLLLLLLLLLHNFLHVDKYGRQPPHLSSAHRRGVSL